MRVDLASVKSNLRDSDGCRHHTDHHDQRDHGVTGETVFTVSGSTATAAQSISLAEAGLKEREHLQEWVIANPQVLGPDVMIVAFEFGRWAAFSGAVERDRLDILALDKEGHLIVIELKRDKAPDTVDMQALKYAALVSRFTRDDLDKVHAEYLSRSRGEAVDPDTAATELDEWATMTEDSLRLPRLVLMATAFPTTVTATVVFLHQQLGLDIRLLAFQAYRTAHDVLLTVSQHYPPPDVEEFVLSPEVNEAKQARTKRQTKQRETSTVARLIAAEALDSGDRLEFRSPSADGQAEVEPWLAVDDNRRWATWQDDPVGPLQWASDGQRYSPTGLARHILAEAAGRTSQIQGPLYWVTGEGQTLVELANALPSGTEVPLDVHLGTLSSELRPVYEALDNVLMGLGPDVERRSRAKAIKYYRQRKLCDLLLHGDHLSVYVQGVDGMEPDASGLVVGGTKLYAHAQVRTIDDVSKVVPLLRRAFDRTGT